jgi:hypothetical protein
MTDKLANTQSTILCDHFHIGSDVEGKHYNLADSNMKKFAQ